VTKYPAMIFPATRARRPFTGQAHAVNRMLSRRLSSSAELSSPRQIVAASIRFCIIRRALRFFSPSVLPELLAVLSSATQALHHLVEIPFFELSFPLRCDGD